MKKSMKKILPLAVVSIISTWKCHITESGRSGSTRTKNRNNGKAKNVIFMIGDGMGVPYTTALRYMNDNPDTPEMERPHLILTCWITNYLPRR